MAKGFKNYAKVANFFFRNIFIDHVSYYTEYFYTKVVALSVWKIRRLRYWLYLVRADLEFLRFTPT